MAAEQRKGRAGRVGPGHVYRLYSSAFFDQHLPRFQAPAILSAPLEDLLLQMKSMGIHDVDSFPFPTPPPLVAVKKAQDLLLNLGALAMSDDQRELSSMDIVDFIKKGKAVDGSVGSVVVTQEEIDRFLLSQQSKSHITELGKLMAQFPLSPRFSKMLVVACRSAETSSGNGSSVLSSRLVQFALSFIAALSEKSPFMTRNERADDGDGSSDDGSDDDDAQDEKRDVDLANHTHGDILARMRAFSAYSYACCSSGDTRDFPSVNKNKNHAVVEMRHSVGDIFSRQHQLHQSTLQRSFDLRQQISKVLAKTLPPDRTPSSPGAGSSQPEEWWALAPPTAEEEAALRQILLSGYCDCIARKAPFDLVKTGSRRKRMTAYISCDSSITEPLYLHPGSTLYRKDPTAPLPECVIYESLLKNKRGDMTYMSGVTVVQKQWIPTLGASTTLLKWSPPLQSPSPFYDHETDSIICYCTPRYGPHAWELPVTKRPMIACSIVGQDRDDASVPVGFRKKDECFRWFARLLLEGRVLVENMEMKLLLTADNMLDTPTAVTALRPLPKVVNLIASLAHHGVNSKFCLFQILHTKPSFLSAEISEFLKPGLRAKFIATWLNMRN